MASLEISIPIVFTLAAIFYALLGLYAWRRRPAAGVTSFAWVMLSMSFWSFTYTLEIFFPLLATKLLILNIEYLSIASIPVLIFFFALDYTGRSFLLTPRVRTWIWLFPALTLLLIWSNPLHNLMFSSPTTVSFGALRLLSIQFEVGLQVQVVLSLLIVIAAGFILTMDFLQRPGSLRIHISFVIIGIFISIIGASTFYMGNGPTHGVDFTPLFFLPTAIGLAWITLQYRLSEILSLEHLTVLKNMNDGVIVLNEQKRVLYINPVTETLLNRTEGEVIGQPFHTVAGSLANPLSPFLTGSEYRTEIEFNEGSGTRTFEASVSSVDSAKLNSKHLVISLHDVTRRKEKEMELSRHGSIMSVISHAAEYFLKTGHWEHNITGILASLGKVLDITRVLMFENIRDEHQTVCASIQYEWTAAGVDSQINNPALQHISMQDLGLGGHLTRLAEGQPTHILVESLPSFEANLLHTLGSCSLVVVPVMVDDQWWATLLFEETRHQRHWSGLELEAFLTIASILGASESRTRTSQKLIRRQLAMSLLQDIVTVSLQATDMQKMAEIVSNRLAELIKADGCFMTLWDETNQRTIPIAAYGTMHQKYTNMDIAPNELTFTKSALQLERTLIVEDTYNTPYASRRIIETFPSKSILVLPMVAMDKKLGAVLIAFDVYHHFEAEEVAICEQASALIALALEKFIAMDSARRKADTSETLRKAGLAIAEELEMEQVIPRILEQLGQVLPYDSASVQLLEQNELVIIGGHGWKDKQEVNGMRFPIPGNNPNSEVIRLGAPLILSDPWKTYKAFAQPPNDHIRSWLGVPLIAQGKTIGLLAIDSTQPGNFKNEDVQTASEFANQVAVALTNVRLFKESQKQAITDALTGIYNRRGLLEIGEYEFQRARRINRPFSIMMFDIDHFKKVNDTHGHHVGDQILHQLAQLCSKNSRSTDVVARYGGEEFVILLAETNLEAAKMIGERLRQSIMSATFPTDAGNLHITSSIGVTEAHNTDTLHILIERVDAALYQAKNSGRNRVVVVTK